MKVTSFQRPAVLLTSKQSVVRHTVWVACESCGPLSARRPTCRLPILWKSPAVTNIQFRRMASKLAPYGLWESPITSSFITGISRIFLELRLDPTEGGKGIVYWLERRPKERGRGVVCSRITGGRTLEWTPADFSVRSSVHEYGGGSFCVYDGVLFFVNASDNRLYMQTAYNSPPQPLTPADTLHRFADASVSTNGIYCIREDHSVSPPKSAIVRIEIENPNHTQSVIAEGADFYSSPRVAPNGRTIVWMQWSFPNMPWDATELWMASLSHKGLLVPGTERKVLSKSNVSYMQPKFSESGDLFFISDESDWWNLYKFDDTGMHKNLAAMEKEVGGPQWQLGESAYSFDPSGTGDIAVTFDGELNIINRKSDLCYLQDTGYFEHSYICFGRDRCIYCIAGDPKKFQSVIRCNVVSGEVEIIERVHEELEENLISVPEYMTVAVDDDNSDGNQPESVVYAYLYSPQNPAFKPLPNTLPPLLVLAHGGPTGRCNRCLDLRIQYYTSRGFAVINVDYRGSSGYGRKYRNSLKTKLGIYDVDDCCHAAQAVVEDRKADPKKLCISGRSSGGYVVLAALAFKDVFSAGVCHYGISDLVALQEGSCKFELHYFDQMIAPYPDQIEVYRERSPINFVDHISKPVAFFHGTNDTIVPVAQIERMHELLKQKKLLTSLTLFEGEGHGYRVDINIQRALDGEYNFFCEALKILSEDVKRHESVSMV